MSIWWIPQLSQLHIVIWPSLDPSLILYSIWYWLNWWVLRTFWPATDFISSVFTTLTHSWAVMWLSTISSVPLHDSTPSTAATYSGNQCSCSKWHDIHQHKSDSAVVLLSSDAVTAGMHLQQLIQGWWVSTWPHHSSAVTESFIQCMRSEVTDTCSSYLLITQSMRLSSRWSHWYCITPAAWMTNSCLLLYS